MVARFKSYWETAQLIPAGGRVLAGYSGGCDSTCLLVLLHEIGVDVVAAHLDHGQRTSSVEEAERCAQFCSDLAIPIIVGRADVPLISKELRVGMEEAGRIARYEFFRQCRREVEASHIATAHTLDDLAETVLFHLARGTGLRGAGSIPERREDVIRPLLRFTRQETQEFCSQRNLWTHADSCNLDLKNARARIRHHIIPELQKINPEALRCIDRFSRLARAESDFLDGLATASLEAAEVPLNGSLQFLTKECEVAFFLTKLLHLPDALLRRALRLPVEALGAVLDSDQTERILDGVRSGHGGSVTSSKGSVLIEWGESEIHFRLARIDTFIEQGVAVPGTLEAPLFGWKLDVAPVRVEEFTRDTSPLVQFIDVQKTEGPFYVAPIAAGAAITPIGRQRSQKIYRLLSNSKLTKSARKRLPILGDSQGVVWVPGVAVADRVKIDRNSVECWKLTLGPYR